MNMKNLVLLFLFIFVSLTLSSCSKPTQKFIPSNAKACFFCTGTGEQPKKFLFFTYYTKCEVCDGTGYFTTITSNDNPDETSEQEQEVNAEVNTNTETDNTSEIQTNPVNDNIEECEWEQVWVDCYHCHGSKECPSCHGEGWCVSTYSDGSYNTTFQCPVCYGNGYCTICGGTGGHFEQQMVFK